MPRISGAEAVERLRRFVGQGIYGLGEGGKVKGSDTPLEDWHSAKYCDCFGAVTWAYDQPRHDPAFSEYGGDLNVDSALMNAGCIKGDHERKDFYIEVQPHEAEPGDLVAFPSVRAHELGVTAVPPATRLRMGHIGMISVVPSSHGPADIEDMTIIECSAGKGPGPAIKERKDVNFHASNNRRDVSLWGKSYSNPDWRTRIIRYVKA
jgi:hypothetical protein